jgi:hypothetical protein
MRTRRARTRTHEPPVSESVEPLGALTTSLDGLLLND